MLTNLGRTLIIANPAAQSGWGAKAAEIAAGILVGADDDESVDLALTESPLHATRIAQSFDGYDTMVALGGDGIVHEVVNGLMQRDPSDRPALGVLPSGSGNDYAKAIGMDPDLKRACDQLLGLTSKPTDIGLVNGQWFAETLSFGLDAAIALGTVEKRILTGHKGTRLYVESALEQLRDNYRFYEYDMVVNGDIHVASRSITFAVQIGPYYGGGFMICPDARLDDGNFDVCISHPPASKPTALKAFALAKMGKHTKMKLMELFRAETLHIEFENEPPAQTDGERITGTTFDVSMEKSGLRVLRP